MMSKSKSRKQRDQADRPDIEESLEDQPLELSEEVAELVQNLERERDEAVEARRRALADFANFQRRAAENENRARQEGVVSVLRSLLPVIDHFDLALQQDTDAITVDQLLGGVKIVKAELMKAMESHGVVRVDPQPGDEFDPNLHEAMMRQPAEGVEPNHVVSVLQPGFRAGERVLRPAKVAVAPEPPEPPETPEPPEPPEPPEGDGDNST